MNTTATTSSPSPSPTVTAPPLVPGLQHYTGPALLSALVQALELGVIINQAITFIGHTMVYNTLPCDSSEFSSSRNPRRYMHHSPGSSGPAVRLAEHWIMKSVAIFALIVSILETASSFQASWNAFIVNFGNWPQAVAVRWAQKIQSLIVVALAAPVQSFLIWRCWLLTNKNIYVLIPLLCLLVASIVLAILNTVKVLNFNFSLDPNATSLSHTLAIDPIFVSTLTIPAFLDVCLTSILLNFLLRSRAVVVSNRFRRTLQTVFVVIWEAALPPCICAFVSLITYLKTASFSAWDLLFQALLGQLYVISLFVTLNGFNDVRNRYRNTDPATTLGYDLNVGDRIGRRSRIPSSNELTMTIELSNSEKETTESKRRESFTQNNQLALSSRPRLSFSTTTTPHIAEKDIRLDEKRTTVIPLLASNADLGLEEILHPILLGKDLESRPST